MRAATPIRTTAFVLVGLAASASLGIAGEQSGPARDRLAPTISPQGFDSQAVAAAIGRAAPVRGLSRRSMNSSKVNPVPIRSSPCKPVPEPTAEHPARPATYFHEQAESTKPIWAFSPGSRDAVFQHATARQMPRIAADPPDSAETARGNPRNRIVVGQVHFLTPSQAKDVSQPTGYEVAPCMDKAATADRESVRDKNFVPRML